MINKHSDADYDWARDAEPIYTFLGIYVAAFQAMESNLDQILLLAGGHDARAETQARLARMSNDEKIKAVKIVSLAHARFAKASVLPGWQPRIEALTDKLDAERHRRNGILHANYMLRGVERGLDAIRTHRRRADGEIQFDQEVLTRTRMDGILSEVAISSFELGQLHLQLLHLVED